MNMKRSILPLVFLCFCADAYTQQTFVSSGNLKIFSGTSVTAFGNFTNNATSSFVNEGNFYVKGNLTNDQSSVAAGTGVLHLNGTANQTISGGQKFKTYHLQTNNSAGFTINNDLSVSGIHTFLAGIVNTSASNFIVYEDGSSYSGATDAMHVNGWVKKYGSTNFTFPTGDATHLREIDITNLAGNSEFDARYNGVILSSTRVTQAPLVAVNHAEYWTLNQNTGGTARVKLNWDNTKVGFPNYVISDLRTAVYSGTEWINTGGSASGSAATTGSITSDPLNSFGRFSIASVSFVIPLKFLGIAAFRENASVHIRWQTANEVAVNFYEVQRSHDGLHFTTIGTAPAKNLDLQSYFYLDMNAPPSKLFYRIKANDLDGASRYSKTATVSAIGQTEYVALVENPVRSSIQLAVHSTVVSEYSYRLINSAGQVCKKGFFKSDGSSTISIPLAVLPGDYMLIVTNAEKQQQFKLVVL